MLLKVRIDIMDSLESFGSVTISVIFIFIITFDWKRNFELWWFERKDLVHICQNTLFQLQKIYFFYRCQFFEFFFKILSGVCIILYSGVCIEKKKHQNLSDETNFYLKIVLKLLKTQIFSREKIRNSGNCIYDYAHSFFGEDF